MPNTDTLIPRSRLVNEIHRLAQAIAQRQVEIEEMTTRQRVIQELVDQIDVDPSPAPVGPTEALRQIVADMPGLSRAEVLRHAAAIVTTSGNTRKVLDQTLRNQMDKLFVEREGKYFTKNGHGP